MKQRISTRQAPHAIGPYAQAIQSGGFLFLSGQIGLDPESGTLVGGGIEAETRQAVANLKAVLAAAGVGPEAVVKTTIFLADIGDFERVNQIYGETFAPDPPARSTVEVSRLPRQARIEIEAVARRPDDAR